LLIELVSPSSNNIEPLPSIFGKGHWDPIPPGWLDLVERAEKPDVERAQRPLTELPPLISPSATPPLVLKTEPSQSVLSGQQEIVPAAAPADIESARSPAELPPLISTDIESPTPNFDTEPSPPTLSGRLRNMASAASTVAPTPQTNVESARPQPGKSLLADLRPSRSFERKPSPAIFSGDLDKVGPAVETIAAATAQQHTKSSPLTDALVSADTESSFPIFQPDLPPSSLSDHPDSAVDSVGAADPTDAEGARPQHISSFLAALRVLTAKPSPPILEKEASRSTLASQPDNAGMSVETIAHPTDAESALARQTKSLLTEMPALVSTDAKSSAPILEKESSRPPVPDQPTDVAPTAKAVAVAPLTDTESAVTRAQQAKALLDELDLNTAIHLRWVMRDIRSKRTKLSPLSDNDLTVLMDLGLVEMREELPRLTALGVLALD
jgi:hypothetical protein